MAINSSGGKLLKWKIGNKFIKTSTFDTSRLRTEFLYESYAEYITSRIGAKVGLDIVKYDLCEVIIDDRIRTIACECDSFLNTNESYLSIAKLMLNGQIPRYYIGDASAYFNIKSNLKSVHN